MIKLKSSNSEANRYLESTLWILSEKILKIIAALLVGVWVARYLGPSQFGALSFAQSLVSLFASIASLGVTNILARDIVKYPAKTQIYLSTSLALTLVGSTIAYLLLGLFLLIRGYDQSTSYIILIIGLGIAFQGYTLLETYYQSTVQGRILIYSGIIGIAISSVIKIILIIAKAPLILFATSYVIDIAILFATLYAFFRRSGLSLNISAFSPDTAKELLREAWPYIFSGILITIYMKIDQIMIKEMMDDFSVGQYAAAVRLSEACYFIPMAIVSAVYPAIVNAKQTSEALYKSRLSNLYSFMFYLAIFISIVTSMASHLVIDTLFGPSYSIAASVLIIHIWASVFVFIGVSSGKWLLTEGLQIYSAVNTLIGAILNITLNYFLIPEFGLIGVAWATLISYAFSAYFCLGFWGPTRANFFAITRAMFQLPQLKWK